MTLIYLSLLVLCLWIISRVLVIIYRLAWHPLARFPGPKFAAATSAYEFYFDAIKGGQYTFEIGHMHRKYGPIVRISPNELHINDPGFIEELYPGPGKPRDKYAYATGQFGIPDSVFGAVSHDTHRMRRGALSPFFSKAAVTKVEPIIYSAVDKLISRIEEVVESSGFVDLTMAFSCMTTDIVTQYAFAESSRFLENPTFTPNFHEAILAGTRMGCWARHFPILFPVLRSIPIDILSKISPETGLFLRWQESMKKKVFEIWQEQSALPIKHNNITQSGSTIFHNLFHAKIPDTEKHPSRMWQEGQIVIGAGTETTAWTLAATTFFILDNPNILSNLRKELATYMPNSYEKPSCRELEALPYLNAVIQEGLRLSYGVATRLQRINSKSPMIFRQKQTDDAIGEKAWEIPTGTPVGMTAALVHVNPELFHHPHEFRPERWLGPDGQPHRGLDKYILSFSRGSRQCIGINLAYSELYMGIGILIRRLGDRMQLFETDRTDVDMVEDCFVPVPKRESKGVRVRLSAQ
ncbi:cytochrome P450 [Aspergillus caelatus]|uniref:Cytochrome P450 monooxygenase otaC n=1 Tax=Aspergillus caelatus TaxID=61420 RepID=A0A5N6ZWV4_9EURO|nr:cytochrome P450 [Aspergillus caelatus]KAE8361743.1 cytochrome P450 [Aspergillus caelatus]